MDKQRGDFLAPMERVTAAELAAKFPVVSDVKAGNFKSKGMHNFLDGTYADLITNLPCDAGGNFFNVEDAKFAYRKYYEDLRRRDSVETKLTKEQFDMITGYKRKGPANPDSAQGSLRTALGSMVLAGFTPEEIRDSVGRMLDEIQ